MLSFEELRQLEADLVHVNRVSTMGEMAASLAHEIKQPIAAAITIASSCIRWLAHEPPNLDRAREARQEGVITFATEPGSIFHLG